MTDVDRIDDCLLMVRQILTDLFQSGFDTVHDGTLEELSRWIPKADQYGMDKLSGMLGILLHVLKNQRHQMVKDDRAFIEVYGELNRYLFISRQKMESDQVKIWLDTPQRAADRSEDESSK